MRIFSEVFLKMEHLFSSGEALYKKNEKELREGLLIGATLEYGGVEPDTQFTCMGSLNGKPVKVGFSLSPEDYEGIKNRFTFKILMQSDILLANWKSYRIIYL
ncbi:MAG TPA: hypothetical protein DD738_04190 [Ruminiclostridium sp.]|nr:hypothetical protein [Ruminiclostridium sp.]